MTTVMAPPAATGAYRIWTSRVPSSGTPGMRAQSGTSATWWSLRYATIVSQVVPSLTGMTRRPAPLTPPARAAAVFVSVNVMAWPGGTMDGPAYAQVRPSQVTAAESGVADDVGAGVAGVSVADSVSGTGTLVAVGEALPPQAAATSAIMPKSAVTRLMTHRLPLPANRALSARVSPSILRRAGLRP